MFIIFLQSRFHRRSQQKDHRKQTELMAHRCGVKSAFLLLCWLHHHSPLSPFSSLTSSLLQLHLLPFTSLLRHFSLSPHLSFLLIPLLPSFLFSSYLFSTLTFHLFSSYSSFIFFPILHPAFFFKLPASFPFFILLPRTSSIILLLSPRPFLPIPFCPYTCHV